MRASACNVCAGCMSVHKAGEREPEVNQTIACARLQAMACDVVFRRLSLEFIESRKLILSAESNWCGRLTAEKNTNR